MLIYAERGLAACLEHSSLFKVNLNQLLMLEGRSPPRLGGRGGEIEGEKKWPRRAVFPPPQSPPSPAVWGRDDAGVPMKGWRGPRALI